MLADLLQKPKNEYKDLKKREIKNIFKLDKAYFQHDMAYRYFKNLPKIIFADKTLRDE